MPDIPVLSDGVDLALGAVALATLLVGWFRKGRPWMKDRADTRTAINEVLLGRPAVPENRITGEKPKAALPSIGQQVAELRERVEDIHHEVHPNGGGSMRDDINTIKARQTSDYDRFAAIDARLGQIEHVLKGELHTAHDAVANAAEANAHLLPVIHDAIKAQPPED